MSLLPPCWEYCTGTLSPCASHSHLHSNIRGLFQYKDTLLATNRGNPVEEIKMVERLHYLHFQNYYTCKTSTYHSAYIVQERRNSSALAMELHLSCINPSILKRAPGGSKSILRHPNFKWVTVTWQYRQRSSVTSTRHGSSTDVSHHTIPEYFQPDRAHCCCPQWVNAKEMQSYSNTPGPHLNIKTVFPRYGNSHVKDKTVARLSYL